MAFDEQLGDDSWQMECTACCNLAPAFAIMHYLTTCLIASVHFFLLFVAVVVVVVVVVFFFNVIDKLDGMVDDTSMTRSYVLF